MNILLQTIIIIIIICVVWWIVMLILKQLLKPNIVNVKAKRTGASSGYIAADKRSTGEKGKIIDESIPDNREVGEIVRADANLKINLRNVLLIDNSGSVAGVLDEIKESANAFIESRQSNEKIAIYSFSDNLYRLSDFDDSKSNLKSAVDKMTPMGVTSLNDSLIDIVEMLDNLKDYYKESEASIVNIILFTDGQDNSSKKTFDELRDKIKDKSLFVVCSGDADVELLIEIAKNPRNVYYLDSKNTVSQSNPVQISPVTASAPGVASTSPSATVAGGAVTNVPSTATPPSGNSQTGVNTNFKDIRSAFQDIRDQIKGRGSLAYILLKDPENPEKLLIRGFVNSRGEIFRTGAHGEGSVFMGLCENPNALLSRVFIGRYVNLNSSVEDYEVTFKGKFGTQIFDVSPVAVAAGAFVIYDSYKEFKHYSAKDSVFTSFGKTALLSALIWLPVFLLYWEFKQIADISLLPWLGKEFDIAITLLILYFLVWFIINNLWTNYFRRKKKISLFVEAINQIVGLKGYSSLIVLLSIIGIFLSISVLPFAYIPLFSVVAISIFANLSLAYGGGNVWFVINKANQPYHSFVGLGDEITIDWSFLSTEENQIDKKITLKIDKQDLSKTEVKTLEDSIKDAKSQKYIQYINECLVYFSVENNLILIDEYLMICGICNAKVEDSDKDGVVKPKNKVVAADTSGAFLTPAGILHKDRQVSPLNRMVLVSAILLDKGVNFKVSINEDHESHLIAIKAEDDEKDSPWVQKLSDNYFFIFKYSPESGVFVPLDKTSSELKITSYKWLTI